MSPDLNDADLERELRRRADFARLDERWAAGTLLPVVRTAISREVPDRSLAPRVPRGAGLAAVLAVAVMIVLVVPRVVPGPAASPSAVSGLTDPSPTSLAEPTIGPIAVTPQPSPASTRVSCPYADRDPEDTEVGITDLAGVLAGCVTRSAGTDPPPGYKGPGISVSNPEGGTSRLDVFWTESALCETAAELELMRVDAGYVLLVDRQPGEQPRICPQPSSSYHGVTLELSTSIAAEDVQALLLESGRNVSMDETSSGVFYLTIGSASRDYSLGDAIDVDAVLGYYEGGEALVANSPLGFGFEQLDGDLEMEPVWPAICQPQELRRDDPLRVNYAKSGGYSPSDPNADFYRRYLEEPELRLPPGIWRIHATANFSLGDDCGGERVSLTASVIVRVSAGDTPVPTATPDPNPSPRAPPTGDPALIGQTRDCAYSEPVDRPTEVSIIDNSGLIAACTAFAFTDTPEEFLAVATLDETKLEIRWQIPAMCNSMPVDLEFWGPRPPSSIHGRFRPPFVLEVDRMQPTGSLGCFDVVSAQGVVLTLAAAIEPEDVTAFVTTSNVGIDRVDAADGTFDLTVFAGSNEYEAAAPIDINASLTYRGPHNSVNVSGGMGGVGPAFGFEQLDGDLERYPGPYLAICSGHVELRPEVPVNGSYRLPTSWPPEHPDADFFARWVHDDGRIALPPGTYRMSAVSSFTVGETCGPDELGLSASIVIHVR